MQTSLLEKPNRLNNMLMVVSLLLFFLCIVTENIFLFCFRFVFAILEATGGQKLEESITKLVSLL